MMTRNDFKQKLTKSDAGRLGGAERVKKHGNPGTNEGRRLGGINSQITHKRNKTNFKQRKIIIKPRYSAQFAEFVGIMLGDGHVGDYQASITTNSKTDIEHAQFISDLASKLFNISAPIRKKKNAQAVEIVLSSYNLCRFLEEKCMRKGNKVNNKITVPKWIFNKQSYTASCLRGLFDTDGSIFLDKHIIKGKLYKNAGMAFVNRNENILAFFKEGLVFNGLHPTQKTKHAVFLRRKRDIEEYFRLIGSSNSKHLRRYRDFVK